MRTVFAIIIVLFTIQASAQEITGRVLDEKKEPLISAVVQVYQAGVLKDGNIADIDGNYSIKPLDSGYYDVLFTYLGYDSLFFKGVLVLPGQRTTLDAKLTSSNRVLKNVTHGGYRIPLVKDLPGLRISGRTIDEKSQPVSGTMVQVYQDTILKNSGKTEIDGSFTISLPDPGYYKVLFTNPGYDSMMISNVMAAENNKTNLNVILFRPKYQTENYITIRTYCPIYSINYDNPDSYIFTREDINNFPW
jgi:hypothetical protein